LSWKSNPPPSHPSYVIQQKKNINLNQSFIKPFVALIKKNTNSWVIHMCRSLLSPPPSSSGTMSLWPRSTPPSKWFGKQVGRFEYSNMYHSLWWGCVRQDGIRSWRGGLCEYWLRKGWCSMIWSYIQTMIGVGKRDMTILGGGQCYLVHGVTGVKNCSVEIL